VDFNGAVTFDSTVNLDAQTVSVSGSTISGNSTTTGDNAHTGNNTFNGTARFNDDVTVDNETVSADGASFTGDITFTGIVTHNDQIVIATTVPGAVAGGLGFDHGSVGGGNPPHLRVYCYGVDGGSLTTGYAPILDQEPMERYEYLAGTVAITTLATVVTFTNPDTYIGAHPIIISCGVQGTNPMTGSPHVVEFTLAGATVGVLCVEQFDIPTAVGTGWAWSREVMVSSTMGQLTLTAEMTTGTSLNCNHRYIRVRNIASTLGSGNL